MKKILVTASVMVLGASGAWALGTEAGTSISNGASLSYDVGSTTQTVDTTADDVFVVDKKIDMRLVTDESSHLDVLPGDADKVRTFTFENEGNANQYFKFHGSDLAQNEKPDYAAPEDKEDTGESVDAIEVRCQKPDGTWEGWSGSDITVQVNKDATIDCELRADIPASVTNNNAVMNVELLATAVTDSSGDTDESENKTVDDTQSGPVLDVVFADGFDDGTLGDGSAANGVGDSGTPDGKDAARGGYILQRPILSVVKTSCVTIDPVNGTAHPKRIPGAMIRYVLDIKNTGSSNASGITVTDTIQNTAAMDYAGISTAYDNVRTDTGASACECGISKPDGGTGTEVDNSGASPDVKFENISVAAPVAPATENHTCVSFDIPIL